MSATSRSDEAAGQGRRHVAGVAECRRSALLGQQVDGERRVAVAGEARRHRPDVVGQAAVLVDDQHRADRLGRRGEEALELAPRAGEPDRRAGRRCGQARAG